MAKKVYYIALADALVCGSCGGAYGATGCGLTAGNLSHSEIKRMGLWLREFHDAVRPQPRGGGVEVRCVYCDHSMWLMGVSQVPAIRDRAKASDAKVKAQ